MGILSRRKKIVTVIGGGTGSVAVLEGLKKLNIDLGVIVCMTDDGGSNKVIRDEFGLLPLSDIRKAILALADTDNVLMRKLFSYRFEKGGGIKGHTLGNLIMTGLSDITGSEKGALLAACDIFDIHGKIYPVTYDNVKLKAKYSTDKTIIGEDMIGAHNKSETGKIEKLSVIPEAYPNLDAINRIIKSDYIIIGPGDLYTSLLANLVIKGISAAIQKSKAKLIFITNLMTKRGETHWMKMSDYVNEMAKYAKRNPDIVLINNSKIPQNILERYADYKEYPFEDDIELIKPKYKVVRRDLISSSEVLPEKGDTLGGRSLIRHSSIKLGHAIEKIIF